MTDSTWIYLLIITNLFSIVIAVTIAEIIDWLQSTGTLKGWAISYLRAKGRPYINKPKKKD